MVALRKTSSSHYILFKGRFGRVSSVHFQGLTMKKLSCKYKGRFGRVSSVHFQGLTMKKLSCKYK